VTVQSLASSATSRPGAARPAPGHPIPSNEAGRLTSLRLLLQSGLADELWWETITRLAAHICGTPFAVVNLIEASYQQSLSAVGYTAATVGRQDSMCATSIMSTGTSFTSDASIDPRWATNPFVTGVIDRVRGYVAAPLRLSGGHNIGTICAFSREVTELTPAQIEAMNDLALLAVRMLEVRDVSAAMSVSATRDPLTELANRALLDESLNQALARHHAGEANVAVLSVRLQDLDLVNSDYGAATGDELLRALAVELVGCVRASDLVARIDGDEFAIMCTAAPAADIAWDIDPILTRVLDVFAYPLGLSVGPIDVDAAVGVVYPDATGATAAELLERARAAATTVA
jgi:diguanylate cyclase (GGDEF)-like protein